MPGNRMFRTPRGVAGKHSPSGGSVVGAVKPPRIGKPILERRISDATTMRMEFPPVDWGKGTNPSPFIHDSPRRPHGWPQFDVSTIASCVVTAQSWASGFRQ